jgi:hypothetical protein
MFSSFLSTEVFMQRISNISEIVTPVRKTKLLKRMRQSLRAHHYSRMTEQMYCQCAYLPCPPEYSLRKKLGKSGRRQVKRFVHFHSLRHPAKIGEPEINAFLTYLAIREKGT